MEEVTPRAALPGTKKMLRLANIFFVVSVLLVPIGLLHFETARALLLGILIYSQIPSAAPAYG